MSKLYAQQIGSMKMQQYKVRGYLNVNTLCPTNW
jgi:hypothetical protein